MIHSRLAAFAAFGMTLLMTGCANESMVKKTLEDHPEYVFQAIENHPEQFGQVYEKAAQKARMVAAQKEEEDRKKKMDEEFSSPKTAEIAEGRAVRGKKDAPVTIIEYSDFQCPYCRQGFLTVEEVREKYGDKVKFMFKHLPLPFHPMAMPAAKRFEALALQSSELAYKFHDEVFKNQDKLGSQGEKFLDASAKKVGANMARMKKDMVGDKVKATIEADMAEAAKFGFQGTPGFLVAGVSLPGAYPAEQFAEIIDRKLKEMNKTASAK